MKKLNSPMPGGGAPFYAGDLVNLQDEIFKVLNGLASGIAPKCVISGAAVTSVNTGSHTCNISAGVALIDGDYMEFPSYSGSYPVWLHQDTVVNTNRVFKDSSSKIFQITKAAVWATSQPGSGEYIKFYPFAAETTENVFRKKAKFIGEVIDYVGSLTKSGVALFDGTGLGLMDFDGFALANGNNGTADMRDRFKVGYDPRNPDPANGLWDVLYNTLGAVGGVKGVELTPGQIPKHKHRGTTWRGTTGSAFGTTGDDGSSAKYTLSRSTPAGGDANDDTDDGTIAGVIGLGSGGNGAAHENRPPFVVVGFIQRIN